MDTILSFRDLDAWKLGMRLAEAIYNEGLRAVVAGTVERGVAVCGSGVGASVCANKVAGVRAALIPDHFSARQGVEDDHMNILCIGGRAVGPYVAWDLVEAFLGATPSRAERHLRRMGKVASLEAAARSPSPEKR